MTHKCDYRRYMIKPQRKMSWTRATQYMLQSVSNEIIGLPIRFQFDRPNVVRFRIDWGVLEYRYDHWERQEWMNAAGHAFPEFKYFDAANIDSDYGHTEECGCSQERLDALEAEIELLRRNGKKVKK